MKFEKVKQPEPQKPEWKSLTFLFNLLLTLVGFWPEIAELLGDYQGTEAFIFHASKIVGMANLALRYKTKGPIGGGAYVAASLTAGGVKKLANLLPGVNLK
jgi:hypothetical protein